MFVREASSLQDMQAVWRLAYRKYLISGLCFPNSSGFLRYYPYLEKYSTVLVAEEDGEICGTISVTTDGVFGLPVDSSFHNTVNLIRYRRQNIACVWRLVSNSNSYKELISSVLEEMERLEVVTVLCTCHPRHVSFYRRRLRFRYVEEVIVESVVGAPAVLLEGNLSDMIGQWGKWHRSNLCL